MKTAENEEVSSRSYYYLLDWNEKNDWEYIYTQYSKRKLSELSYDEYKQFFEYATKCDFKFM